MRLRTAHRNKQRALARGVVLSVSQPKPQPSWRDKLMTPEGVRQWLETVWPRFCQMQIHEQSVFARIMRDGITNPLTYRGRRITLPSPKAMEVSCEGSTVPLPKSYFIVIDDIDFPDTERA